MVLMWWRLELRRRWRSLLVLGVLVAVGTCTVLASFAGARRGASAVDRLLAVTLPGTAVVVPNQSRFDWHTVEALPEVEGLTTFPAYSSLTIQEMPDDSITPLIPADANGMRTIERPVVLAGRLADPTRVDEVMVTPAFVHNVGRSVGDSLTVQLPTLDQAEASVSAKASSPPDGPRVPVRVVGVVRSLWWGDDVGGRGNVIPSPALLSRYTGNFLGGSGDGPINALVRLRHGSSDLAAFRTDLARVTGRSDIDVLDRAEAVDHARKVTRFESACLLAFGLASLLAVVVLVGQAIRRYVAANVLEFRTLRAVGLTRSQAVRMNAIAPAVTTVLAAGIGVGFAVVCSRWMPFGAAGQREPHPGFDIDWLVLGVGWLLALILVASAVAVSTWASLSAVPPRRRSSLAASTSRLHLPVPVSTGARFALDPGLGRRSTPVRPALLGSIVGVAGVLAASTFSAGVTDAATHAQRFGRNYQLQAVFGFGGHDFAPAQPILAALAKDAHITGVTNLRVAAATSGTSTVVINSYDPVGTPVPIVLTSGVGPTVPDEIVLAPSTARRLRAHLGSSVPITGDRGAASMRVVGLGYGVQSSTTSYDDGGWVIRSGYDHLFSSFKEHGALLAVRSGVSPTSLLPLLGREAATVDGGADLLIIPAFQPVQLSEIADVRVLPVLLAGFLILLGVLAVGQSLVVTIRSRRHEIAILRTLGMTPRQARGVATTQSMVYAAAGLLVGIPFGLAIGRRLWRVATDIMPLQYQPPVARWALFLVVPVVVLIAAALSVVPGRRAARLRIGELLRTE